MNEVSVNAEKKKLSVLYHASTNRNIEVLEPRAETIRDRNEGPVVFATADKAEASKFLVPSNDSWTMKMRLNGIHIHIISNKKRYEELDKGGTIYQLKPDNFENDETKRAGIEWTSKVAVKPIKKEEFESGLKAQLENGVQVYFVDKVTFERIKKSSDHGNVIIRGLVSENKIRNVNFKEMPPIYAS